MEYIPEELNEKQMEHLENHIENWLAKYEDDPPQADF